MEINYVREFVTLAHTGNFLEAADRLYISQSSLSKHIKIIEEELGAPLFNRTTRKVHLSELGKLFLPYAEQIVHAQDSCRIAISNQFQNDARMVTLGCIPSMAQYHITDILVRFKREHVNFTVNVIQDESDILENMLRQKKCELAFVRQVDNSKDEFVVIPYVYDSLAAVLPSGHALASKTWISLEELKNEDFMEFPKHSRPYALLKSVCAKAGFEPRVVFTDHQIENILDLVGKGMGISLLMKKLALYLEKPGLAIVDIVPPITTQVSICYRKGEELTSGAKLLLDFINSEFIHSHTIQDKPNA